ncbi:hypothetical protein V8F33_004150 [Rhypophila sp. PSN 637]
MARHTEPREKRQGKKLESAAPKRRRAQGKVTRLDISLQGDLAANEEPLPTEETIISQPTLSSWLRSGRPRRSPPTNQKKNSGPKPSVKAGSSSSGPGTESAAQPVSGTATKDASTGTSAAGPTQQAPPLPPPSSPRPSITYRELWLARPRREAVYWGRPTRETDDEADSEEEGGNMEKEKGKIQEESEEDEEDRGRGPLSLSPMSIRSA